MGWYFRKSINFGGIRLNLSKSGIGVSAGVRGLRYGVTAKGQHYIHCGAGGIYYRKTLGTGSTPPLAHAPPALSGGAPPASAPPQAASWVQPIGSGNVHSMVDPSARELLSEIRTRHSRARWHTWCAAASLGLLLVGFAQNLAALLALALSLLLVGTPVVWFIDRHRKQVTRLYHLDAVYAEHYRRLLAAFDGIRSAARIWAVSSHAAVYDRKYHAGASGLIERAVVVPQLRLPAYFKSNITPPMLRAGRRTLYLFPDAILVFEGSDVGIVGYGQLTVVASTTRFIESELPPRDAQVVGQTWQYVNKAGGPDRRFSNNRTLPIMLYGELQLQSTTGLNAVFQISRIQSVQPFEACIKAMAQATNGPRPPLSPIPDLSQPWPAV